MFIVCVCGSIVHVALEDFGISYHVCSQCGREYEVVAEFSLAVDIENEEGKDNE
jgi:hypothetical protein